MKPVSIKKVFAVSSFVLLISLFVLYRSGSPGTIFSTNSSPVQTSPNGGAVNNTKIDSTAKEKPDSLPRLRMPSSKMMTLIPEPTFKQSAKAKEKPDSISNAGRIRMFGSKSAIIADRAMFKADTTVKRDSAIIKQKP